MQTTKICSAKATGYKVCCSTKLNVISLAKGQACSVISQYDLNSQLNSPALSGLQTYLFMHLNYEMSACFFGCIVFISTLTPLFSSSRRADSIKSRTNSESEPGWNLYIINTVSTIQLYREMVLPNSCFCSLLTKK